MKKKKRRRKHIARTKTATPKAYYPRGWDRRRAEAVAEYFDNQSDDAAIAEAEAALRIAAPRPGATGSFTDRM